MACTVLTYIPRYLINSTIIEKKYHHHHVQEGLGLIPVPCILKMKLVPPSLLGRPMCLRHFGLYCSACLGSNPGDIKTLRITSKERGGSKKNIQHKISVLIFSTIFSETFLILRIIQGYMIINICWSSRKAPAILPKFN